MAGELFGFTNNDLIGLQLNDLITLKQKAPVTIGETHLEDSGDIVEVSGKSCRRDRLFRYCNTT